MKKALIICAAGMSSSMMAKKVTEYLQGKGEDIELDAVSVSEGEEKMRNKEFDLYLISPQTTMHLEKFQQIGEEVGVPVVSIPFPAYVPVPTGIEKLATLVEENING
ncbi:MAG: PTS cellobiose transporter subunit IIB [Micrococcaceae bacterium]